jgi:mono/diheme cytochrome c family protein
MNSVLLLGWLALPVLAMADDLGPETFRQEIAPLLEHHCLRCHSGDEAKGDVDLSSAATVVEGRGDGWLVVPGKPDESYLLDVVSGDKPAMPKAGDPLSKEQIAKLRNWIAGGAPWPGDVVLKIDPLDWWSLRPLERPALPEVSGEDQARVRTPVDAFVLARLREHGLSPSAEADRRTLVRRLFFDLTGLPPTPEEVRRFTEDSQPGAYEKLVDRLLDSPRYGERWARHWLDVVHYGDTHGYDKDKVRPNAWPYRDYVIRALNEDRPYGRFVKEQLAGDHFYPQSADGTVALGFIAAGPFDFVGHIEVANGTMEKKRVRNIDRDDMVSVTMNTFVSLTAQCARCHDHKFDPISQEDYYSLQAVFAAVDRADRPYDTDPQLADRRRTVQQRQRELAARKTAIDQKIKELAGPGLAAIEQRLAELAKQTGASPRPEFGYHSLIMPEQNHAKWVQIDLGQPVPIADIVLIGAYDDFAGIGAGFGFPVRYKLEVSDDPEFQDGVAVVADKTTADVPNPGIAPQSVSLDGKAARYVRLTATKLAERQNDYIFALGEMSVFTETGVNVAAGATVTALDSIEAPVRWSKANLVDGIYRGSDKQDAAAEMARLNEQREALLQRAVGETIRKSRRDIEQALNDTEAALKALPPQPMVYAAASEFAESGNFVPTHGEPRPIFVLRRGNEQSPLYEAGPGTVGCVPGLPSRFQLGEDHGESQRRAALAEWIVDPRNPLTWRSIVNRIWYYHFGRGLVETPNDFGRMGARPTHPELLDWLAVEFRDGGQSIKNLHRLIVNSAAYRQSSAHREDLARIDAGNQFLWRMNRRRLEAEAIRDSVLAVSGKLRHEMGGPGFRPFGFEDDHSPRYLYHEHEPDDPASHRRSIYRFIVRSVPDPFMTALDCADPSLIVDRRNETMTALQALALLNNDFMVRMAEHFAERVQGAGDDVASRIAAAYRLALGRSPSAEELSVLVPLAEEHGMANVCRLVFNTNEFVFID